MKKLVNLRQLRVEIQVEMSREKRNNKKRKKGRKKQANWPEFSQLVFQEKTQKGKKSS